MERKSSMASNQTPSWMSNSWQVVMVDPGSTTLGVFTTDTVVFTSPNKITYQHNIPQTTTSAQDWGTWDTVTATGLSGHTSSGNTPFHIDYDTSTGQLTCYLDAPPSPRRHLGAVVMGAILGALAGAAAGVLAGSPLQGFLTGLLAASTGSLVTAARGGLADSTTGGPTVTWVANDGSSGTQPKPHPLKAVSA
jgi:hypothetical protein